MKEIKTKKPKRKEKNWVLPGTKLTQDEFESGIQKAEEGPFHSVQESMEHFETWLKTTSPNADTYKLKTRQPQ